MSFVSNTVLALSLSADAFAAAAGKGAALRKPKITEALRLGAIFGVVSTITPVLGWVLGSAASSFVASVDHWIAFAILSAIGAKMIYEGACGDGEEKPSSHSLRVLLLLAVGISIDALAVGVTLAFLNTDIWLIAAMIGSATFLLSVIGFMIGHFIGRRAGKGAEILGGLCLIAIGTKILLEHLSA